MYVHVIDYIGNMHMQAKQEFYFQALYGVPCTYHACQVWQLEAVFWTRYTNNVLHCMGASKTAKACILPDEIHITEVITHHWVVVLMDTEAEPRCILTQPPRVCVITDNLTNVWFIYSFHSN